MSSTVDKLLMLSYTMVNSECPNTILWVPIDVKIWRNGKNCFCLRGTQINCFKRSLLFSPPQQKGMKMSNSLKKTLSLRGRNFLCLFDFGLCVSQPNKFLSNFIIGSSTSL